MSEITVINNYVEIPPEPETCSHENDNIILFLGKMDYEPNITAVKYFVEEVFPSLKDRIRELEFLIVGARPSEDILSLCQKKGITVTGYVEKTAPYFQKSAVVVAPMLSGAGVQNKIIQAMAYGCCVATTDIGAEGLNLKGNDLAIFNSTSEWINGLSDLLLNRSKRLELGRNARETVKLTLSKNIVFKQFCKMIENIN